MEYFSPKVRKGIESKSKTISRRGFVLSIAKVSFFGIIFSRLVYNYLNLKSLSSYPIEIDIEKSKRFLKEALYMILNKDNCIK